MYFLVAIYIITSNIGILFIKLGSSSTLFQYSDGLINLTVNYRLLIGLLCYIASFLMYIFILSKFNLSYIIPIITGVSYILTLSLSYFVLHETIGSTQLIGIAFVLVGVVLMNLSFKR